MLEGVKNWLRLPGVEGEGVIYCEYCGREMGSCSVCAQSLSGHHSFRSGPYRTGDMAKVLRRVIALESRVDHIERESL